MSYFLKAFPIPSHAIQPVLCLDESGFCFFSEVLEISYFPFVGRFQTLQTFSISWPERTEMQSLVPAAKAICLGLFSEEA